MIWDCGSLYQGFILCFRIVTPLDVSVSDDIYYCFNVYGRVMVLCNLICDLCHRRDCNLFCNQIVNMNECFFSLEFHLKSFPVSILTWFSFPFPPSLDFLFFTRDRIPGNKRVQRESALYRGHQQERRVDTAESGSVQRQRHLLLWREEPAGRVRNSGSNGAQGRCERWMLRFCWC